MFCLWLGIVKYAGAGIELSLESSMFNIRGTYNSLFRVIDAGLQQHRSSSASYDYTAKHDYAFYNDTYTYSQILITFMILIPWKYYGTGVILFTLYKVFEEHSKLWQKSLWGDGDKRYEEIYSCRAFLNCTKSLYSDYKSYEIVNGQFFANAYVEMQREVIGHTDSMANFDVFPNYIKSTDSKTHGRLDGNMGELEVAITSTISSWKNFEIYQKEYFVKAEFMKIGRKFTDKQTRDIEHTREDIYDTWIKNIINNSNKTMECLDFQFMKS